MPTFEIKQPTNQSYGRWEGRSPARALLNMFRVAGYGENDVWIEDGELAFRNEDFRRVLGGGVDEWNIERV